MNIISFLQEIVQKKLTLNPPGIFSICTSNPYVLKSCFQLAKIHSIPYLIETTCNQVNQFGGYTKLTPERFAQYIHGLAFEYGLSQDQILLGGDHLGPFAWKNEPADHAMQKSIELVTQYIRAGYRKIHLDASISCLDDPIILPKETITKREVVLCKAAVTEIVALGKDLSEFVFVVGTEVPTAGGAPQEQMSTTISSVEDTEENINLTRTAFVNAGLEAAWERTLAFVVQPGVEFGDTSVHAYDRQNARHLSKLIEKHDNLVFEAHSTDYQTRPHLGELVNDHFAFLKVGPALTYALREVLFALSEIEEELFGSTDLILSDLINVLEQQMVAEPEHWIRYYCGNENTRRFKRKYSLLDRSRYYFSNPEIEKSLSLLFNNLSRTNIPFSLISQFVPDQFRKVKEGKIGNQPMDLISGKIADLLEDYIFACNL